MTDIIKGDDLSTDKATTILMASQVGDGDKLVLDTGSGYAPCPDKELYEVMYCEKFVDEFYPDDDSFMVCNCEYFETVDEAIKAFNFRLQNDPFQPSGLPQFEFPPHGLGDILADALARKDASN